MPETERRRVHVIPQTRGDAGLIPAGGDGVEAGFLRIESALHALGEDRAATFALDGAWILMAYLQSHPEKKPALMRFIGEGRLTLEGAMLVSPDLDMPCGESFIRQVIEGRAFFESLGIDARCAWTLDASGCHPQMPQVFAGCGFDWAIIPRGTPPDAAADFLWQGMDGTRVFIHCMPLGCDVFRGAPSTGELRRFFDERLALLQKNCEQPGLLALCGPDLTRSATLDAYNKTQECYEAVFSTPARYFEEVMDYGMLPAIAGDFTGAFRGCFSARIAVKQRNRALETSLLDWEKLDAAASFATSVEAAPSPASLATAWQPVLLNQAPDIICGTHVDEFYRAALESFASSEEQARLGIAQAAARIVESVDTRGEGMPVAVFNTLGHGRADAVETDFTVAGSGCFEIEVRNAEGIAVPSDLLSVERDRQGAILRGRVLFIARDLPSFGYEVYRIVPLPAGCRPGGNAASDIIASEAPEAFLENARVRVCLDEQRGIITGLIEKSTGWDAVSGSRRCGNTIARERDDGDLRQFDDASGLWPFPAKDDSAALFFPMVPVEGKIRHGNAFAELCIDSPWGTGSVATRVRIYAGLPRVEIATTIVNNDERCRYRAAFPTSIAGGRITHEIPFGAVERPAGELPAQTWIDYGARDGSRGVALLNRGLPGNNVVDGVMMLSLLRCTAPSADSALAREKGVAHTFHYALYAHAGDWRAARPWEEGHDFNTPVIAFPAEPHGGSLPARYSWFAASDPRIVLSAVRRSDRGIVIRVYEATGAKIADARLILPFAPRAIVETDLAERNPRPMAGCDGRTLPLTLDGCQIRTFLLQ